MSSRNPLPLELSPAAEEDIVDILAYTQMTWGEAQVETYLEKIQKALETIAGNFELGHTRSDLPSTHLAYLVGSHVIIYRAMPNKAHAASIGVLRILHQRMSLARHV
jgi:toxin ParE1/3/4